jgi:hypothetical protein
MYDPLKNLTRTQRGWQGVSGEEESERNGCGQEKDTKKERKPTRGKSAHLKLQCTPKMGLGAQFNSGGRLGRSDKRWSLPPGLGCPTCLIGT